MNIYQAKHWTSSVSIFVCFFSPMQRANDSTSWANGGLTYHSFFPLFLRVKPLHYISWLIGHEGTGSVLSLLRRKWVLLPSIWFVFFVWLEGPPKSQLKGLQFTANTYTFSCSQRLSYNFRALASLHDVIGSFSSLNGCGCTRAVHPLCAKW